MKTRRKKFLCLLLLPRQPLIPHIFFFSSSLTTKLPWRLSKSLIRIRGGGGGGGRRRRGGGGVGIKSLWVEGWVDIGIKTFSFPLQYRALVHPAETRERKAGAGLPERKQPSNFCASADPAKKMVPGFWFRGRINRPFLGGCFFFLYRSGSGNTGRKRKSLLLCRPSHRQKEKGNINAPILHMFFGGQKSQEEKKK